MNTTRILENVSNDISIEIKKLESELNEYLLPEKQDQLSLPSFHSYAIDLRKSPEDKLYLEYLKELSHLITDKKNNSSAAHVLEKQKMMIMGRKIWSDVVSETDAFDTKYIAQHDIKERTINRIKNLGYSNPDKIYADCLQALQQNTRLIITFSAKRIGLISGIKDFQRLNIFECSTKGEQYLENRNDAEIKFLSFLTPHLKELFVNNIHARPRYGVLQLVDVNTPPNAVRDFGKSFVVLADKAKMNCIFAANDTMKIKNNTPWTMCTISHLAVLRDECDDIKLKAVIKNAESKKCQVYKDILKHRCRALIF